MAVGNAETNRAAAVDSVVLTQDAKGNYKHEIKLYFDATNESDVARMQKQMAALDNWAKNTFKNGAR